MQTETGSNTDSEKVAKLAHKIADLAQDKHLLLGIDRDGTLVAYADRPEDAVLDPHVHELMCKLSDCANVTAAVVSARSTAQLRGEFDEQKLILAGNYGLEICYPGQSRQTNEAAAAITPTLRAARNELAVLVRPDTGAILEDHGYSLCLHWHTVPTEMRPNLHKIVSEIKGKFPDLHWQAQPTSYEVLPALDWSKAKALASIAQTVAANAPLAYVFIGDSAADEPAFAWVNERKGLSVKVGSAGGGTVSTYQLADTKETESLLERLVRWLSKPH